MKLPMSWLKEYVPIDVEPEELKEKLPGIGFEVEEIIYTGDNMENVVVGKIIDIKKHFSADKLLICTVDVGKEITTIVTSATNVAVGDKVPVALDGALLPTGKRIKAGQLRGVNSYGMFCSGGELMIDDSVIDGAEADGILILPSSAEVGDDVREVLGLNEYILDISVTANRPDCQSVYGMAREIAALYGKKIKKLSLAYKETEAGSLAIPPAKIDCKSVCSLYTGRVVTDIKVEKSPKWMRDRLRHVGIRSINNIVDITNYVLMEVGQPLHAFDLRNVDGEIRVRYARSGEKIVALDGKEYALGRKMAVIADKNKPLAIAGVMGGEYSGIRPDTRNVFLEAARFAKGSIRTTSRELGLRSDSSARYEKGVDYAGVELGRERALSLIYQLKAGKITTLKTEDGIPAPEPKIITTSAAKINDLFGIEVKQPIMEKILRSLEFEVSSDGDKMVCCVPAFREDVDNYTDLAEEIIRFYGYDNLTADFIKDARPTVGGVTTRQRNIDIIKNVLVGRGAYECCTYSFINKKQFDKLRYAENDPARNVISILKPLSEEFAVMRTQLVGSMLDVVYNNLSKKNEKLRLFEVAKTYFPKELPLTDLPEERDTLCIAYCGAGEDFYSLKAAVGEVLRHYVNYELRRTEAPYLHSGVGADIVSDGKVIGSFGKVHPAVMDAYGLQGEVYVAEIDLSSFIDNAVEPVRYKPIPKFPVVERDLAVVVDEAVTVGELMDCIHLAGGAVCESAELFDIYRGAQVGEGKKSVAFNLRLCSDSGTLVDAQIQEIMNNIVNALGEKFSAKLR